MWVSSATSSAGSTSSLSGTLTRFPRSARICICSRGVLERYRAAVLKPCRSELRSSAAFKDLAETGRRSASLAHRQTGPSPEHCVQCLMVACEPLVVEYNPMCSAAMYFGPLCALHVRDISAVRRSDRAQGEEGCTRPAVSARGLLRSTIRR